MNRFYKLLIVALTTFFSSVDAAYATHNMGKDIQYECLGISGGNMQYRVTVCFYRNCWDNGQAVPAPPSVSLQISGTPCGYNQNATLNPDLSAQPANGTEVSQLCPAQIANSGCNWSSAGNPPYPGVQIYTYTGIVTVPVGCTEVTFGTTDCCCMFPLINR